MRIKSTVSLISFSRIIQPRQLILRRHSPVRIAATAIVLAVGFGVRPVYITPIVLRCPHQVCIRVQDCPVVIGDETAVPGGLSGTAPMRTLTFSAQAVVVSRQIVAMNAILWIIVLRMVPSVPVSAPGARRTAYIFSGSSGCVVSPRRTPQ